MLEYSTHVLHLKINQIYTSVDAGKGCIFAIVSFIYEWQDKGCIYGLTLIRSVRT